MSAPSSTRLLALHGLRLKGIAEPDAVAGTVDADTDEIRGELERLAAAGLAEYRYGRIPGYLLTDEGRAEGRRLLAEELRATGARPAIEDAYSAFRGVNARLLEVCTDWQLRDVDGERQPNDHTDADHDEGVRHRLLEVHADVQPVLDALVGALPRFGGHGRRLQNALERFLAGEHAYLTKPMFPSYHSTWFELHEDLLATLGIDRSAAAGSRPDRHADEESA